MARGRIGRGAEAELVERYRARMTWPVQVTELPDRGGKAPALPGDSRKVLLDEGGQQLTSMQFADMLRAWRDAGVREARFLIGAADGLTAAERAGAALTIGFGAATWPHLLVRAMLMEQLYRATTIIAGHPYHREG